MHHLVQICCFPFSVWHIKPYSLTKLTEPCGEKQNQKSGGDLRSKHPIVYPLHICIYLYQPVIVNQPSLSRMGS